MFQSLKEEISSVTSSVTSSSTPTARTRTRIITNDKDTPIITTTTTTAVNIDETNDPSSTSTPATSTSTNTNTSTSTSKFFTAGLSKTKSIFASTTSSLNSFSQSVSDKAPSIIATTTSSFQETVKKTSAQLQEINIQSSTAFSAVAVTGRGLLSTVQENVNDLPQEQVPTISTVSSVSSVVSAISSSVPESAKKGISSILESTSIQQIPSVQEIEHITHTTTTNTMNSLSSILPSRKYTVPDKAVASQVLMYRQILHTECKPGLRLSRGYEGTEAQRKVKHMPWWEHGVEQSKRMVISYNNLIVRLWLNGAIMPYVDGGYASDHVDNVVPKDDEDIQLFARREYDVGANDDCDNGGGGDGGDNDSECTSNNVTVGCNDVKENHDLDVQNANNDGTTTTTTNGEKNANTSDIQPDTTNNNTNTKNGSHINTLIDSNGLPPIPHPYWVDRLGFQQTDPVTDFRSGGVLSLAMLVHIVEACPNVHARFLPSGDTHMLPFGITCINITDMLAKFCMLSKAVDRMDALLSQKPFWRMFADPNSLLVLQELSMEVLCNVVVEMGRERKMPKVEDEKIDDRSKTFIGQDGTDKVTVFDFAEILAKTEKRVHDDLLGSGPKTVDDLRAIHSRNFTKYMKALERKEQQAKRQYDRAMQRKNGIENFNYPSTGKTPKYPDEEFIASMEEAKKATINMTESVIGTAGGVFNKFKSFSFLSSSNGNNEDINNESSRKDEKKVIEEINFAMPKSSDESSKMTITDEATTRKNNDDLFDMSDAPAPPIFEESPDISIDELFDFDDAAAASSSNFTIDDDDFL